MSFLSKIWLALGKLGHLVGCKMVVVTSIVKRATLGKQTNDCGNRSNTRIKSNSDHPIIWKEYSQNWQSLIILAFGEIQKELFSWNIRSGNNQYFMTSGRGGAPDST